MADDLERWRGEISTQLINMAGQRREDLNNIDRDIQAVADTARHDDASLAKTDAELAKAVADLWKAVNDVRIQLSVLSTRIGVYAALGGIVGSIVVGVVVFAITGQLGGHTPPTTGVHK